MIVIDDRKDYAESRYRAIGYIKGRLHADCYPEDGRPPPAEREQQNYDQ